MIDALSPGDRDLLALLDRLHELLGRTVDEHTADRESLVAHLAILARPLPAITLTDHAAAVLRFGEDDPGIHRLDAVDLLRIWKESLAT